MPEDILLRLGKKIKKARKSRHLTQQKVSDKSGVAVRTISKIERGLMNPSFELLAALVPVLGVSFDSLFRVSEEAPPEDVQELIGLYQSCTKQGQKLILATAHTITQELAGTPQE